MEKKKILTFSFDDNEDYDRRLCDLFRKYNIKATFFLISGELAWVWENYVRMGEVTTITRVSPEEIKETYKGMEVASHTDHHKFRQESVQTDIIDSAKYLSELCGYEVTGFAYPGGEYKDGDDKVLEKAGIKYGRTIDCTHNFSLPENWYYWHPTCAYLDEDLEKLADEFLAYDGEDVALFNIYGHSYELSVKQFGREFDYLERFLQKIANRDDILYATYSEIADMYKK